MPLLPPQPLPRLPRRPVQQRLRKVLKLQKVRRNRQMLRHLLRHLGRPRKRRPPRNRRSKKLYLHRVRKVPELVRVQKQVVLLARPWLVPRPKPLPQHQVPLPVVVQRPLVPASARRALLPKVEKRRRVWRTVPVFQPFPARLAVKHQRPRKVHRPVPFLKPRRTQPLRK